VFPHFSYSELIRLLEVPNTFRYLATASAR